MPEMDGIAATAAIRARAPKTKVLLITALDADRDLEAGILAGAAGLLLKNTPRAQFATAIKSVHQGASVISPAPISRWAQSSGNGPAAPLSTP